MDFNALLQRPLDWITDHVLRKPRTALAIALLLTLGSLLYTGQGLGYRTSRVDLLDPNSDYNRLWLEYTHEFGDDDDAVVVVEGRSREEVVPVLDALAKDLATEDRLFRAVLHGVNLRRIQAKGLHYVPPEELAALEQFVAEVAPVVRGHWTMLSASNQLGLLAQRLEAEAQQPTSSQATMLRMQLDRLSGGLLAALEGDGVYQSPWPAMSGSFDTLNELSSEYLLTNEGRLGFVLLHLARNDNDFDQASEAINELRRRIAIISQRHGGVTIGLTGLPVMENDEMRASQSSMLWASMISLAAVGILFVAGFGGLRHAILANLVLLMGMAWAFGYVTLAVGHLNILSISFTATLIGIGIDYGVHYVARYLQLRPESTDPEAALRRASHGVGPAIMTGALTTAIAFFAAGFTKFTGVAELGIIAGGGILICCLAELIVLPAVILLVDRGRWGQQLPTPLPITQWLEPLLANPRRLLISTVGFALIISLGASRLWYDHNLLNMQADGIESVELERKLLTECNQSLWYAVSIADTREELLARKAALANLASVERTEEIVSLLPVDQEVKRPMIERIGQALAGLPERPPLVPVESPEQVGQTLALAQQAALTFRDVTLARRIEQVRDVLRRLPAQECCARISRYQQQMAGDLLSRLHAFSRMADPEPPRWSDLPAGLVDRFVSQHDRHLLRIYGRGNIWDMDALKVFVADVRSVDPRATGNPLQAYEASREMKASYEEAALYSLALILAVLWCNFRHLGYALLAASPLVLGVTMMFGLMGLLNIPLNPANMIALPLIMGLGVDYGIHLVHDYREQQGLFKITPSTAVAVVVDSLTTIVGFGSMMIASHRGLQSLGRVLTIGVACCLFTSMIILPAMLTWMSRWRSPPDDEAEPTSDTIATAAAEAFHARDGRLGRIDPAHTLTGQHEPAAAPQQSEWPAQTKWPDA